MSIATRPHERIGLASVQHRVEARIDEHVQLDEIHRQAAEHDCTALPLIDRLRVIYRDNTPAFTGEAPEPSMRLIERIAANRMLDAEGQHHRPQHHGDEDG